MGGGTYSHEDRQSRSITKQYATAPREQVFRQRHTHPDMDPKGVRLREARDSDIHPNSLPIIFALDVTASMGAVPHELIKYGLPNIIKRLQEAGIESPAIMFMAIGDHKCDEGCLQISQFESGDAELDMWLENVWLEGGGGGNGGESYSLAHYFANSVCVTDHWEKRGKKGYIFTIGDEANHTDYPSNRMEILFGRPVEAFTDLSQLELAQEKWHVHHIIPGTKNYNEQGYWDGLLGENAHSAESVRNIPEIITNVIIDTEKVSVTTKAPSESISPVAGDRDTPSKEGKITL